MGWMIGVRFLAGTCFSSKPRRPDWLRGPHSFITIEKWSVSLKSSESSMY